MTKSMCGADDGAPLVTVVLPVYQVIDYLDESISSILDQSFNDFELIVIDDGSTDGSEAKCDAWALKDSRIVVVHQKNAGQSSARNLGISMARGEYLLFVDSDDYLRPSLLDSALNRLETTGSDICFFKYSVLNKDGQLGTYKESELFPNVISCGTEEALGYLFTQCLHHYPWMRLAKTELYAEGIRFFPVGRKMEDIATTPRLVSRANSISFLDEELYVYRKRDGSTVDKWSHQLTTDTIKAVVDIEQIIKFLGNDVQKELLNYKAKMLFYCLMMECGLEDFKTNRDGYELAKQELARAVSACGWNNLTPANKAKFLLMSLGLTGMVARAKRG